MKNLIKRIDVALDYYVHEPEKTHVIIQTYFLNRMHVWTDKVVLFLVELPRPIIRWLRKE